MGERIRVDGPTTHIIKRGTPTMGGLVFIFVVAFITFVFNQSRTQTLFPVLVAGMAGLFGLIEDLSKIYKSNGINLYFKFPFLQKIFTLPKFLKMFSFIAKPWGWFVEFWRVVGSSDDRGLQTYQKFFIQSFIGGFVAYWTYFKLGWDYIWFPLIGNIQVGIFYPILIFLLFITVMNFVAFTDGVDGLASGLGIISFLAIWAIASFQEYNSLAGFAATFVGALLPFLYFNINPARIFMGNVGSHVLGATLLLLGIVMHREVAILIVLAVFLMDGVSSPMQQVFFKLTNKRLFRMAPVHHHFELLGWSETKVTLRFWLFGALFAFLGILVALL
ncbi:phospho-N-acetylmuramoyl-pentapeptide-transferase [candidate division WWE3 bacterium]|nr:phospho-N-acetylmuramoyl-pentapeptide-transferase [candidate division WWE3 bacterium]